MPTVVPEATALTRVAAPPTVSPTLIFVVVLAVTVIEYPSGSLIVALVNTSNASTFLTLAWSPLAESAGQLAKLHALAQRWLGI